ncbi:MAG: hypothetical protein AB8B51_15605 [Sedimentitalea sp.]
MNDVPRHAQLFALLNSKVIEDEGQNTIAAKVIPKVDVTDAVSDAFLKRAHSSWGDPVALPFEPPVSRETQ